MDLARRPDLELEDERLLRAMAKRPRIRHRILAVLGGLFVGLSLGIAGVVVTLTSALLHGGVELLTQFWAANGIGYEDLYKWPLILIGIPGGVAIGIILWRWTMCRIGLMTPDEYEQ